MMCDGYRFLRTESRFSYVRQNPATATPQLGSDPFHSSYKCDNLYCKESERGLMFNDPALKIDWPKINMPILLSVKDQKFPSLVAIERWERV